MRFPILIFLKYVCCLIILFVGVKAKSDRCTTPGGIPGQCINIYQCNHVLDLIKLTRTASSPRLIEKLRKYECGRDGNTVKVCCYVRKEAGPSDVSTHRNLNLLPSDCGKSNGGDKVIRGVEADLSEFPWMALLSYRNDSIFHNHLSLGSPLGQMEERQRIDGSLDYTKEKANGLEFLCGGTIINSKYILTAANCITKLKSSLTLAGVRLGEHNILTEEDCQDYEDEKICAEPVQDMAIEEIIPHPQYTPSTIQNNIGLIRVKGTIKLKQENISPICLPITKEERSKKLTAVTVAGWGRTERGSSSNVLMKVVLDIVNRDVCQEFYNKFNIVLTDMQICASRLGKDSCSGDSGGPLMGFTTAIGEVKFIQYGIVSFGPRICAQPGQHAVYTDVRPYMPWILDTIKP